MPLKQNDPSVRYTLSRSNVLWKYYERITFKLTLKPQRRTLFSNRHKFCFHKQNALSQACYKYPHIIEKRYITHNLTNVKWVGRKVNDCDISHSNLKSELFEYKETPIKCFSWVNNQQYACYKKNTGKMLTQTMHGPEMPWEWKSQISSNINANEKCSGHQPLHLIYSIVNGILAKAIFILGIIT